MFSLSICANTAKIPIMALPIVVEVSNPCVTLTKEQLCSSNLRKITGQIE